MCAFERSEKGMEFFMEKGRPLKNENGAIYYDKVNGRWECWYYVINSTTIKKQRKCKRFDSEDEAKEFLSTIQYQKENVLFANNNGLPLNLLIESNIQRKFDLGLIGGNQYNRLKRTLKTIEKWELANKNIDELKSEEIQTYLNSLKFLNTCKLTI